VFPKHREVNRPPKKGEITLFGKRESSPKRGFKTKKVVPQKGRTLVKSTPQNQRARGMKSSTGTEGTPKTRSKPLG